MNIPVFKNQQSMPSALATYNPQLNQGEPTGESDESANLTRENLGFKDILQPILATLEDFELSLEASIAAEAILIS